VTLANDPKFRGKLIIDVAELQFFFHGIRYEGKDLHVKHLNIIIKKPLPRRQALILIMHSRSKLVFVEEGKFGLTALLNAFADT